MNINLNEVCMPFNCIIVEDDMPYEACINLNKIIELGLNLTPMIDSKDRYFNTHADTQWLLYKAGYNFHNNKIYKSNILLAKYNWNGNMITFKPDWVTLSDKLKIDHKAILDSFPERFNLSFGNSATNKEKVLKDLNRLSLINKPNMGW